MGLQFESMMYLLLLLPAALFLYWVWKSAAGMNGWRRRTVTALRGLIVLLLILSLAGLQSFTTVDERSVVFVADRSDSVNQNDALEAWLREAARSKGEDDTAGVVSTGLEAAVERMVDGGSLEHFGFGSVVNSQFTRLDGAVQLAATMLPQEAAPRIVLLSDGRENVGDVLRQGKLLRDRGIPVDVVPLPSPERADASVDALRLPEKLLQAEQYSLEVKVSSTMATSGELRIYEDNREIAAETVALEPGTNRYAIRGLAKEQGLHRYRAELYANGDEVSTNNAAYGFSRVEGPPKVLLVEGADGAADNIAAVLSSGLIPHDVITPELLPLELSDYTAYDSIVLANVSATRLSESRMLMIEQAVRDYGIGLVMTGGEESFGLGGYFKTPIERALPVYMDLRGKREIPSLALMLVIDKSGSMSDGKMELAREAAVRTVELMREKDTIGVLAFDSTPWWVVEPQKLTDPKKVTDNILSIQPDGGTEIYTAVAEAFTKLKEAEAQRKHIILLTDGQSATNQSYEALAEQMVSSNITLSSVAIGEGADTQLLEKIATLAQGRYYFTNDQSTVPAIFSREAVLVSRTYIVDQPFTPAVGQSADWSSLFRGSLPTLNAYIATTPKELAETVLMSPEPDPVLARWQYGSGRAVAWTSDVTGEWSGDWVSWSRFPEVFGAVIKWTFPQFEAAPLELSSRLDGNEVTLDVRSTEEGTGELTATITDEALRQQEITMEPTSPGEYSAKLNVLQPGVYLTRIEGSEEGAGGVTTGFVIPYSPEYKIGGEDGAAKLRQLAELTGGRILSFDNPAEVFTGETVAHKRVTDQTRLLLIAALLLWIVDIALRRVQVPWERVAAWLRRRQRNAVPAPVTSTVSVDRLRERVANRSTAAGKPPVQAAPLPPLHMDPAARRPNPAASGTAPTPAPTPAEKPKESASEERMNRLLAAKQRRGR